MDALVIKEEQRGYDKPKKEEEKPIAMKVEEVILESVIPYEKAPKDSKQKETRALALSSRVLEDMEKFFQESTNAIPQVHKESKPKSKKTSRSFEEEIPQKKVKNQEANGEGPSFSLDEVLQNESATNESKNTKKVKNTANGKQKTVKTTAVDSQSPKAENGPNTPSNSQRKRKLKNIESPKENGDQTS